MFSGFGFQEFPLVHGLMHIGPSSDLLQKNCSPASSFRISQTRFALAASAVSLALLLNNPS
jgi:hypothetical protein